MGEIIKGILCAALAIGGAWLIWRSLASSSRCTEPAEAVIVGTQRRTHRVRGRREAKYYPVLKFTVDGVEYQAEADVSSIFRNKFKEGETMQIRCNPEDPGEFMVKGKSLRSGLISGIVMLVLGLLGGYLFFLK